MRERPGQVRRHGQRDLAGRRPPDDRVHPTERQRGTGTSDDERSPDNIAPIVAYLASTASDWLTGQVIGARGYEVHLMNKPEPIRHVVSNGPWEPDRLADLVERVFKPAVS